MTNQTPIEEATGYLEARRYHNAILRQEDCAPIDTIHGKPLTTRTLAALLEQIKLDAERIAKVCAAGPTAWWFDTGEFDYDPPKLHATEGRARAAAVEHWKHFNYPREVEFTWASEPNDDPDEPDPGRGFELIAGGHKTGHFVRPVPIQGAQALLRITQESIDLIRNTVSVWHDNAAGEGCAIPHPAAWYRARIADFEQLLALVDPAEPNPTAAAVAEALADTATQPAGPEPTPTPPWLIEAGDD